MKEQTSAGPLGYPPCSEGGAKLRSPESALLEKSRKVTLRRQMLVARE
jgi:hypothetical protein